MAYYCILATSSATVLQEVDLSRLLVFLDEIKLQGNPNFFLLQLVEMYSLKGKPLYIGVLFSNGAWKRLYA